MKFDIFETMQSDTSDRSDIRRCYRSILSRWCPKGRKAEDGPIAEIYLLQETASADYLKRTEWNARDSDATAIFCFEDAPTGGTKRTVDFAKKHGRPFILVQSSTSDPASVLLEWLKANRPKVLNVSGPRESKASGIQEYARRVLTLDWEQRHV